MSLSSNTPRFGNQLLAATKGALARAQATRTADAVKRYMRSSETNNDLDNYERTEVSQDGGVWVRHDSENGDITFTRRQGETLTISKSRGGDGWMLVYDEPVVDLPA